MGEYYLTEDDHRKVSDQTKKGHSRTAKAEEAHRQGKGLDPLVDPAGFGVIRRSLNRVEQLPNQFFKLLIGIAMLIEYRLDTTGSMGNNIDLAFDSLTRAYELLRKVLKRYDLQIITSIFADYLDDYILCRSQAEMGIKIAEQMTMMVPERDGKGNHGEDPQYGLFGAAFLTSADINRYGLKSYDFTVTDEPSHEPIYADYLVRVFGPTVFEKLNENGFNFDKDNLPTVKETIDWLLKRAHAFVFIVGDRRDTLAYWPTVISKDRIIFLEDTRLLPEVQAAIIGLTEGTLTLASLEEFLITEANLSTEQAKMIKRAVAGIPIGAQTLLENFDKIPLAGSLFKEKRDLWPVTPDELPKEESKEKKAKNKWL